MDIFSNWKVSVCIKICTYFMSYFIIISNFSITSYYFLRLPLSTLCVTQIWPTIWKISICVTSYSSFVIKCTKTSKFSTLYVSIDIFAFKMREVLGIMSVINMKTLYNICELYLSLDHLWSEVMVVVVYVPVFAINTLSLLPLGNVHQ